MEKLDMDTAILRLKYQPPKGKSAELSGYFYARPLKVKEVQTIAEGSPKRYVNRVFRKKILFAAVLAFIWSFVMSFVFYYGAEGPYTEKAIPLLWGTLLAPVALWWVMLFGMISARSKLILFFGQFASKDLDIKYFKRKRLFSVLISLAVMAASAALLYVIAVYIHHWIALLIINIPLLFLYAGSYFYLVTCISIRAKRPRGCEKCGMVNAVFRDGEYDHDFGPEGEMRYVGGDTYSYQSGTVYDDTGSEVGKVMSTGTISKYEVGQSYTSTSYYRCACCGNVKSYDSKGFKVTGHRKYYD